MNSQEEAIKRPFPFAIVAYLIYLRLLHSGMTPEGALKLADAPFGHFIAECCQLTRDAGLTPYQRDIVPGFACSVSGSIRIAARSTENMVCPSACLSAWPVVTVFCGRACLAGHRSSWGARFASFLPLQCPPRPRWTTFFTPWRGP